MEAPEKIHIQPNAHDRWFEGNIPNGLPNGLFVEYIHKDVFINKACEWLKKNRKNYSSNALGEEYLIDDFKKAMKEE